MGHLRLDTIDGVNALIAKHRAAEGVATVGISTFNTVRWRPRPMEDVRSIAPFTAFDYMPAGGTALHDSMATSIDELGATLASKVEWARPSKVIFVVITDGEENASRFTAQEDVKRRVEHQAQRYGWDFVFLGANMDAFAQADALGIAAHATANYFASAAGVGAGYETIASSTLRSRSTGLNTSFDAGERATLNNTK